MKKTLLAVAAIAACLQLSAQYTFSESSGAYVPLSANADTISPSTWEDEYMRIGLPFQVNSYGEWFDSVLVEINGELILYNDWTGLEPGDVADTLPAFLVFGEIITINGTGDLKSRGADLSPVLMEVTGAPGSRIMKVEWRNAGFYCDPTAGTNFVNFQVWIHETTGDVEYHYGTSNIHLFSFCGSTGPTIGIGQYMMVEDVWDMYPGTGLYVTGTTTSETGGSTLGQMTGQPADSTIYFFTNLTTGTTDHVVGNNFMLYPNPAADVCYLEMEHSQNAVMITDAAGRVVMESTTVNTTRYTLDVSTLAPGMYFVTVTSGSGSSTRTLSVQ